MKSLAQCGFEIKPSPGEATKVCYDNAQNFSQPSVHYRNAQAATPVANSTWPGVVMDKGGEFYCHDFGTKLTSLQVIFSDKGNSQTVDLTTANPDLCYKNNQWTDLSNCISGSIGGGETWYFRGTSNA
ncbi:starch-binding protein [Vibrio sp. PP-XX7]